MSDFGENSPQNMPEYMFHPVVSLDYSSAVKADIIKQSYLVCPRHWYIDAVVECSNCHEHFKWTKEEQKHWFEEYRFWVDSHPKKCKKCYQLKLVKAKYDSDIARIRQSGSKDEMTEMVKMIEILEAGNCELPPKVVDTKNFMKSKIAGV